MTTNISEPTYLNQHIWTNILYVKKRNMLLQHLFNTTYYTTSCGLCKAIRYQKRKRIKKDRTNICRVCMLSNSTFITKTSVGSGYVGLTSLYERLWPDSLSTRRGKPRVVAYATGFWETRVGLRSVCKRCRNNMATIQQHTCTSE